MNIGILYTGGTIGCTGDPLTPLSESDFEKAFNTNITPIIQSQYPDCYINFIQFGTSLDSTNLQPSDWCKMAKDILPCYDTYDAFIVLHGTDTMAWTASALSFLFTGLDGNGNPNAVLSKTIVVTGSQLPLFHQDSNDNLSILFNTDAYQNVCGAVASAYSGVPEVCLYFNDTLFRGNRTVKTNASEFNAFSTPNYPNLGKYGVEFEVYNEHILPLPVTQAVSLDSPEARELLSTQLNYISENIDSSTILPFLAYPAYYDDTQSPNTSVLANMLSACLDQGVNGLILESYGEGNFPSGNPDNPEDGAIYQTLEQAHENGVVIVDCTQVLSGTVNSGAYASGSWLSDAGAIGGFDMTPIATLTKLIYLWTLRSYNNNNWDQSMMEQLMMTNFRGEMMDVNRLDSRGEMYLGAEESITALDGSAELVNDYYGGPMLKDSGGTLLWSALNRTMKDGMPGQLYMQKDGNLVFYDQSNTPLYASDTGVMEAGTSVLILDGEDSDTGIRLYIYNYAKGEITKVIYPENE